MASIENSLKYEAEVEPGKVRLVTSGEFVRAYNHSAWLFYCCISKYKVIRKFSKTRQENIYFLGFPISKLLELTNGRVCEKTDFGYDITLKPEEVPAEEGYEAWTKEVPVEAASRADASALPLAGRELESAVCKKIRKFPLETKTPVEVVVFFRELFGIVPKVREFLREELELELNEDKVRVINAYNGVEFLGAYVKPYRTYPSTRSLSRIRGRMKSLDWSERPHRIQARVNSMLGVLSHYDCYQRRRMLVYQGRLRDMGEVSEDCLRFYPDRLRIQRWQTTKFGGASCE